MVDTEVLVTKQPDTGVMTRSSVCSDTCVGPTTCCCSLASFETDMNRCAELSVDTSTWRLKSPRSMHSF